MFLDNTYDLNICIKKISVKDLWSLIRFLANVGNDFPDPYFRIEKRWKIPLVIIRILKHTVFNRIQEILIHYRSTMWKIVRNSDIIGIAYIGIRKNRVILHGIYIDRRYRGLGLGKKLLETVIEYCKKNNFNKLLLFVEKNNYVAINLYRKYGFRDINYKNNYVEIELMLS